MAQGIFMSDREQAVTRKMQPEHAGNRQLKMPQPHMAAQTLIDTARTLVAGDKGLPAMNESNPTCAAEMNKTNGVTAQSDALVLFGVTAG